jgi:hypothetical protein
MGTVDLLLVSLVEEGIWAALVHKAVEVTLAVVGDGDNSKEEEEDLEEDLEVDLVEEEDIDVDENKGGELELRRKT